MSLQTLKMNAALQILSPSENELVKYVYFEKHSLNKYSQFTGIPYPIVINMKNEILYKLKKALNTQSNNNKKN